MWSIVAIAIATLAAVWLKDLTPAQGLLSMVYLAAVLVCSVVHGRTVGIFSALLAFLSFNFLFLKPRFGLTFEPVSNTLTLGAFLAAALLTGTLAGRVRDQARETAQRAATMTLLFNASRALGASSQREELARILAAEVANAGACFAHVFLRSEEGIGWAASGAPAGQEGNQRSSNDALREFAERGWTQIGAEPRTDMRAAERLAIQPIGTLRRPMGLVVCEALDERASAFEKQIVSILCELGAVALERVELMREMTDARVVQESDRLKTALLSSLSHDFRTPLSGILAAVTALIEQGTKFSPQSAAELLSDIRWQAERANRYVANLLDMIKLEAGAVKVKLEPTDIAEIVSAAVRRCGAARASAALDLWVRNLPPKACLVEADPILLEQAIFNILDNALQYSPADAGIEIQLRETLHIAEIVICDQGPGIPRQDLERVFDKFHRLSATAAQGTGLGLSISRGLTEAMGGTVRAVSPIRGGSGTAIHVCLKRVEV
jgi:two-component system sensor histidine kinase KdpD